MKKMFLMILACSFVFAGSVTAGEKVVLSNGEWKPYLSKDLKHYGVASHIVTEAFKRVGIDVEYKWYGESWKRAYKDAQEGRVDGTLVWSKKPEREAQMYYSGPIITGKQDVFFHLKSTDFDWSAIKDLQGKRIGGVHGYTYGALMDEAIQKGYANMDLVSKESLNLKKLLKGRIDLFLTGSVIGTKLIKEELSPEDAAKITYHPKPVREATYHLLLTRAKPANADIMKKFDQGLKALKDEGIYDKYMKASKDGAYE